VVPASEKRRKQKPAGGGETLISCRVERNPNFLQKKPKTEQNRALSSSSFFFFFLLLFFFS
jgi:hypothetical protein